MHSTSRLSWWIVACGREIHLGLHLNEEAIEGNDVDDQPTPIIKLPQAHEYVQLLSNLALGHPLEFSVVDVMNMQSLMDKFNKMLISNINKHHHKTLYFVTSYM